MNVFAPEIPAADWARWREEAACYPEEDELPAQLAEVYETGRDFLLPTAGAIDAIYLAARLFAGERVAVFEPGFSEYARALEAANARVERLSLDNLFSSDLAGFAAVILGNPNNPCGTFFPAEKLLALPARALLVDEAFIEFTAGRDSLLPVLPANPQLILFRSLTKSWRIPGLRLGFLATAEPAWMQRLRAMQPPWTLNSITVAWAREHLTRDAHERMLEGLCVLPGVRAEFVAMLASIPQIAPRPGSANFLLIKLKPGTLSAAAVFDALAARGFLVRICDSFRGLEKGRFLRVAVRAREENAQLAAAFAEVLNHEPKTSDALSSRLRALRG